MTNLLPRWAVVVTLALILTGCAAQAGTKASIPTALATYDRIFDASVDLVTRAGYNITRADKASGTISGLKQIGGDSLHFNMLVKRASEATIDVTLIRGGGMPMPRAVYKADARQMLRNLAGMLGVPQGNITVTLGDETKPLDQF